MEKYLKFRMTKAKFRARVAGRAISFLEVRAFDRASLALFPCLSLLLIAKIEIPRHAAKYIPRGGGTVDSAVHIVARYTSCLANSGRISVHTCTVGDRIKRQDIYIYIHADSQVRIVHNAALESLSAFARTSVSSQRLVPSKRRADLLISACSQVDAADYR